MTLAFGVIGYLMIKADLPRAPLVLGVVLAPLMEASLRQSLMLSTAASTIFVERPIAAVLLVAVVLSLALPFVFGIRGCPHASAESGRAGRDRAVGTANHLSSYEKRLALRPQTQ